MNKPLQTIDNKTQQQAPQQTFVDQVIQTPSFPSFCSPFRKYLPTIYETESSPYKEFPTQKVDHLQSQYESRLIAVEEELFGSMVEGSMPDSRLLNPREKQLLNKIYQKEKELVMLENKIHLLKNSNQCLRDTIKEDQVEKQQLNEEIFQIRQETINLKQKISQLSKRISELQQQSHHDNIQQREQQKFFREYNLQSQSIQQLTNQNIILKKQIQELRVFYEEEIYRMLDIQKEDIRYLEEKASSLQRQNSEHVDKIQQLSQKLQTVNTQKKEMLEYYLKVIEQMKRQMSSLRANPPPVSQPFIQDSVFEPRSDYCPENNYSVLLNENIDLSTYEHMNNKSIEIGRYSGQVLRNGNDKSHSKYKSNKNSRPKPMQKSGSLSSLNAFNSNINMMEYNPNMHSSFTNYKYPERGFPTSRFSKLSPSKKPKSPIPRSTMPVKTPISSFLFQQSLVPRVNTAYSKKYQQIDRKLQIIKEKITKQIAY